MGLAKLDGSIISSPTIEINGNTYSLPSNTSNTIVHVDVSNHLQFYGIRYVDYAAEVTTMVFTDPITIANNRFLNLENTTDFKSDAESIYANILAGSGTTSITLSNLKYPALVSSANYVVALTSLNQYSISHDHKPITYNSAVVGFVDSNGGNSKEYTVTSSNSNSLVVPTPTPPTPETSTNRSLMVKVSSANTFDFITRTYDSSTETYGIKFEVIEFKDDDLYLETTPPSYTTTQYETLLSSIWNTMIEGTPSTTVDVPNELLSASGTTFVNGSTLVWNAFDEDTANSTATYTKYVISYVIAIEDDSGTRLGTTVIVRKNNRSRNLLILLIILIVIGLIATTWTRG